MTGHVSLGREVREWLLIRSGGKARAVVKAVDEGTREVGGILGLQSCKVTKDRTQTRSRMDAACQKTGLKTSYPATPGGWGWGSPNRTHLKKKKRLIIRERTSACACMNGGRSR